MFHVRPSLDTWSRDLNSNFYLKDWSFEGVKLAKNADPDKYLYSGYGIGLDLRSEFSLPDGSLGSSVYTNNKKKDVLIPGIGPTQELDDTTLTAVAQYSINFSRLNRIFFFIPVF